MHSLGILVAFIFGMELYEKHNMSFLDKNTTVDAPEYSTDRTQPTFEIVESTD